MIKVTYSKTAQKNLQTLQWLPQAELAISKITDGISISSINRKPYSTDFIFFLASS
jgi:hypothetical protein